MNQLNLDHWHFETRRHSQRQAGMRQGRIFVSRTDLAGLLQHFRSDHKIHKPCATFINFPGVECHGADHILSVLVICVICMENLDLRRTPGISCPAPSCNSRFLRPLATG